jgi:uncharacterized protein YndB with AHSA1/START domain
MATKRNVRVVRTSTASPEAIWEVLSDHEGMSGWTPLRSSVLEKRGDTDPNGVGAVRALRSVNTIREEIVSFEPPQEMTYRLVSGLPANDYQATVQLLPEGRGTRIVWGLSFFPRVPGLTLLIERVITDTAKRLAREAERRS